MRLSKRDIKESLKQELWELYPDADGEEIFGLDEMFNELINRHEKYAAFFKKNGQKLKSLKEDE